ncbi:MAG: TonB-dependent receptor domain-containing protein [Saprospiraceae bacterium]
MKKIIIRILSIAILLIPVIYTFGQQAVVSGKVIDKITGETLIGATFVAQQNGTQVTGTVTDFDGNYNLEVAPGIYDFVISYTGYTKQTITNATVNAGTSNIFDIVLESQAEQLTEVVVTATVVKNTDAALITLQRRAFAIQDGVSSQQISRTGSSNAADAMRQMTGAVVEGGRFVVMRGLGDRYSLSQLNGITLPSTDPYRNSTSLDLIPAQMIENIVTSKTFTPDQPGNFSGGLVNINTKSFPDKFTMSFTLGTEYNTQASLIDNFLTQEAGDYDWLGLDDGSRDQPAIVADPKIREQLEPGLYLSARNPSPQFNSQRELFNNSSKAFSNEFVPSLRNAPLNTSLNFSLGNRFKVFGKDLGFTLGLNYSSNFINYEDGVVNTFINTNSAQLFDYQALTEQKSTQNPQLGILFNTAYKFSSNHALNLNIIFNNDAEIVGRSQQGRFLGQVSNSLAEFNTNSLEFTQRQFTTYQLGGKHVFPGLNNTEIEWLAGTTNSLQKEPDLRYFAYTVTPQDNEAPFFDINNAEFRFPLHLFRDLQDDQVQGKLDISIPFLTKGNAGSSNRIKFGGLFSQTERDFSEVGFQLNNTGAPSNIAFSTFGGDFQAYFNKANFGIIDTTFAPNGSVQRYETGYHYINQVNNKNFYTGEENILAAYLMGIYNLTPSLKAVAGVRMESTDLKVQSQDPTVPVSTIDITDFLYSANLIYSLSEKANIRVAASQTLARPNMRELAPFLQFDTKNGFFNVGNPLLKRTLIQNYDIRYELYPRSGELFAISGFYKIFQDPIIRAFNPRATIPELSFINVDEATVYGVELEFRKGLDFVGRFFQNFYFSTNLAVIQSSYDIPADEIQNSKNIDSTYNQTTRPFQGQAPYIVNLILSYINPEKGWEASLAYNVSGEKLFNIALFATPDIYEQPFPLLNFKLTKRFADRYQFGFTARNIINPRNRKTQTFRGNVVDAESFRIGTGLGLSFSYFIR